MLKNAEIARKDYNYIDLIHYNNVLLQENRILSWYLSKEQLEVQTMVLDDFK